MTHEAPTMTRPDSEDRQAAVDLATEAYDNGVTSLSEYDELDNTVAELNSETYRIPVYSQEGKPLDEIQVRNIGKETIDAMGNHSSNPADASDK